MGRTPALKAAQKRLRGNRKRVELWIRPEDYTAIQDAATAAGLSAPAYLMTAAKEKMERDALPL